MAKTLNEVCIPKGKVINDIVDLTSIEKALMLDSLKYNTTMKVDEDSIFLAPEVIADAVAMVGCEIAETCDLPTVLVSDQYTFMAGCELCLNEMTSNEKKAFGMNVSKPEPTTALENRYENRFIGNTMTSTRKINWLGSTAYTGANLANAALLPNYKKTDGIWTRLVAMSPAAPHYVIAKNALATKEAQTAWTVEEVLAVLNGMKDLQTLTMKSVVNDQKYFWVTDEMYDAIISAMTDKSFDICCVGTLASQISGGQEIAMIMYGDFKIVKYSEFSAAIKDLALVDGAWNVPNRAVLALGLPIVNYTEQGSFNSDFDAVTGKFKASYSLTTALVDPYGGDFYVLGY